MGVARETGSNLVPRVSLLGTRLTGFEHWLQSLYCGFLVVSLDLTKPLVGWGVGGGGVNCDRPAFHPGSGERDSDASNRAHVTSSKSKIQKLRATKVFILIGQKGCYIYICLQLFSSIESFVWKPAHFEFQSFGGA